MSDMQYQAVYNTLSFALASMMATTMYLWFRSTAVRDQFKSAVLISGLVTFIAAYHYIRIFPMLGITASNAVVAIQIGYCVSDIISKCGVGLVIYQVTYAKSNKDGALLP